MKIVGIHAGLSDPSSSEKLLSIIFENVDEKIIWEEKDADDPVEFENFSLRDYSKDLLNGVLTGFNSSRLESLMNTVSQASAVVFVSPVMSASYSSLFKMFMELVPKDLLNGKPVLLGATAGTKRHSLVIDYAMKPVLDYHHARILSYSVFAATDDWGNVSELSERIDKAGDELISLLFNSNTHTSKKEKTQEKVVDETYEVNDSLFGGLTFHDLVNGNND